MRPYKAGMDITNNSWYGHFYCAGFWRVVSDSAGSPIRFVSWYHANHAAKMELRREWLVL